MQVADFLLHGALPACSFWLIYNRICVIHKVCRVEMDVETPHARGTHFDTQARGYHFSGHIAICPDVNAI